jgi:membrane protein HdeD
MQKMASALIMIILGLIVLAFPLLGLLPVTLITGFIVLILGIGLLLAGIMEMGESASLGIVQIIFGIIALILGIGFMVSPDLFAWVAGFIIWIAGLLLLIAGIVGIISKTGGSRWNGVIAAIIGLIYIVIGNYISSDPKILGALIGLWLIITGIMMLVVKE